MIDTNMIKSHFYRAASMHGIQDVSKASLEEQKAIIDDALNML